MYLRTVRGMGAVANPANSPCPTKPWTDPSRPSWLPCFIDTPTESENKILYDAGMLYVNPPAPPTVQPPPVATDPTGQTANPDAQIAAQVAAENAALAEWAAQQNQQTPVDNFSVGAMANCFAGAQTITDYLNCIGGKPPGTPGIPSWVFWAGGLLLGGLVLMNAVRR